MVRKRYDWVEGVELQTHSERKHKILREYIFDYLAVRCTFPQQALFRLAIVDGFAGGGQYKCGTPGSPLIFIEELKRASESVNRLRAGRGLGPIKIECLLVLNDADRDAINLLRKNVTPLLSGIGQSVPQVQLHAEYLDDRFEIAYPKIKSLLAHGRYRSVLFNLDQCGDSHVEQMTIRDILHSYPAAEIFYTFMIDPLLAFLQKNNPDQLRKRLRYLELTDSNLRKMLSPELMTKKEWLGAAERIVFDTFRLCAPYVSPFSINNPDGWRYWLIHFSKVHRARQVYNNVLHKNANLQAHFGRAGLEMLQYDPRNEGQLYLFDESARLSAKEQLTGDIPRLVEESGDAISVGDFYGDIYNATPAHADDIHASIIENPDLEVITPDGGERRRPNTIGINDVIKLKRQRSFFPSWFQDAKEQNKK